MNITKRKERKRLIPFIKHHEHVSSANRNNQANKMMTKREQKRYARDVVSRIVARIKRI